MQDDAPIERRITRRLVDALTAVREATEMTIAGDADAFFRAIEHGVSANLCEALVSVMEAFREIDVTVTWARTRPASQARDGRSLRRFRCSYSARGRAVVSQPRAANRHDSGRLRSDAKTQ